MNLKIAIGALAGGVLVTLLTSLVRNMQRPLLGATNYGYPFAWLTRLVIAPEFYPWRIDVSNLIADTIVWTMIVGAALFLITRGKRQQGMES